MKVTITTASQNLETILSTALETYPAIARSNRVNEFHNITIINAGANTIYFFVDNLTKTPSTALIGVPVAQNGSVSNIKVNDLSDIAIISATSSNTDVLIIAN